MKKLRLRTFVAKDDFYHVGATDFRPGRPGVTMHTHDFAEVFFISEGRGVHLINGQRVALETGDLCMIRPADAHGFRAADAAGFSIVNVAFEWAAVEYVQRRYFPRADDRPWRGGAMPAMHRLSPEQ